ncbi:MAG: hypothetical protein ACC662_00225 [Planctomycetota bacterium]
MPIAELDLTVTHAEPPADVLALIGEAERTIEAFIESRLDDPIIGFVPADFRAVYPVLRMLAQAHLAPGNAFCEWGSGFGVVALLASTLGFDACGIEIEPDLVEASRDLAARLGLETEFFEGSFIPEGGAVLADTLNEFAWLDVTGPSAYEEMELDPDDFDVIFAYPWPGEEGVVVDLFEHYVAPGALLVTYQGVEDVHVRRKVRR